MTPEEITMLDYHRMALHTKVYDEQWKILYPALKIAGEAGEVSEKVGKVLRDNNGEFTEEIKQELIKELGDVLWYIAALSDGLGHTLDYVARRNLDKLLDRQNRGVLHGSGDNR